MVLRTECLCPQPPPNYYAEGLAPNVAVFADGTSMEVIKVK